MSWKRLTDGNGANLSTLSQFDSQFAHGESGYLELSFHNISTIDDLVNAIIAKIKEIGNVTAQFVSGALRINFTQSSPIIAAIIAVLIPLLPYAILAFIVWVLWKWVTDDVLKPASDLKDRFMKVVGDNLPFFAIMSVVGIAYLSSNSSDKSSSGSPVVVIERNPLFRQRR